MDNKHNKLFLSFSAFDEEFNPGDCYDLKLELRLHLGKDLRKDKGICELVKHKDTGVYLHYIYD